MTTTTSIDRGSRTFTNGIDERPGWAGLRSGARALRATRSRPLSGRRRVDPTDCEREFSLAEQEFAQALQAYKRRSGRMFPTCSEVLEVLLSLGYEKPPQGAPHGPDALSEGLEDHPSHIDFTRADDATLDATIEGWSRALSLRDKETEGHSRRVTAMSLRLARAMGLSEAELVHVRRGALLHDIGKMGIPDAILHKPGPLTDEEWEVLRRHPQYAHDWLAPIPALRPALDIPYGHHERWDGTGYPRGLKGEQIPLAARIFAVVDVWDALRSDRPYRAGWPEARVCAHIRTLAGTHLDPKVVEAFLRVRAADERRTREPQRVLVGPESDQGGRSRWRAAIN
jgi:HD-GYP domain-containing protein (c-di-GMP phosphodiesterase class II)